MTPAVFGHESVFCRSLSHQSTEGGTVLDPFAGAGTSLVVAQRLARDAIGIELNPEYVGLAEQRLIAETPGFSFAGATRSRATDGCQPSKAAPPNTEESKQYQPIRGDTPDD